MGAPPPPIWPGPERSASTDTSMAVAAIAANGLPVSRSTLLFLGIADSSTSAPVTAVAATSPLDISLDEILFPPLAVLDLTCQAILDKAFSIFEPSLRYSEYAHDHGIAGSASGIPQSEPVSSLARVSIITKLRSTGMSLMRETGLST